MKHFVFAITLFASLLYFGIGALLGNAPSEDGGGASYKYFCIFVFAIFICCYLNIYLRTIIRRNHVVTVFILLLIGLIGVLSGYASDVSVLTFIAFSIPASGIAVYYAEHKELHMLVKWIDVILPILSISLFFSLRSLLVRIAEGDSYYSQSLSYEAAYCFVFYVFFLLYGDKYERFSFFRKKIYRFISILMLPYLIIVFFFGGGRGALGTILVGLFILLYIYHKHHKIKRIVLIRKLFRVVILAVLLFSFVPKDQMDVYSNNFDRVFSFFDTNKELAERTSGRNSVMSVAFDQIKENPLFGSGLFSYKDYFSAKTGQGYPHNFFIEILQQGGLLFLLVVLIILSHSFFKLRKIIRAERQELLLILGVFAMTSLMYSGSYLQEPFFWFFFIYIYNYKYVTPSHIRLDKK